MILGKAVVQLKELPETADLVKELRQFNSDKRDDIIGWLIQGEIGEGEDAQFPTLVITVDGERGGIYYVKGGFPFIPAHGVGTDGIEFRHPGQTVENKKRMFPGSEVHIETLYEVVAEFARTQEQPTCIEWKPATIDRQETQGNDS